MKILSMTRRVSALALFGAVVVLTASCGGSSGSSGGSTAGLPSTATITIPKADRFEPFLLEIAAGGTVTFTNQDTDAHTVVSMPTDPVDFKLLVETGKSVKQTFKVSSAGDEPFIHVFKNLYAVPTPFGPNSSQTEIEDLFDIATRAIQVGGKSFSSAKDIDEDTQYGKRVFAHRVIAAKAAKIDFSGFKPLLTNITNAIKAHHVAVVKPSTTA